MGKRDIKIWQAALISAGTYKGKRDGVFGEGTRRASFEAANLAESEVHTLLTIGRASLLMANGKATRNQPITIKLRELLILAATEVYGANCKVVVYSGGQDKRGEGKRRTGSIRHDNYGQGGRAADCYIYVDGRKLFGLELAKLGQYWLSMGYGACGLEMATGGIHLDEWTTPPSGGGLYWTYAYSDGKSWGAKVRGMLRLGSQGHMP